MFESHITVEDIDINEFQQICKEIKVKPILIEMDSGSNFKPQMMTRKFHRTNSSKVAEEEMNCIASNFRFVTRRKLEFIIKDKAVPCLYYEFHAKFEIPKNRLYHFVAMVAELDGHTSRNSLKIEASPDSVYHFVTTRNEIQMQKLIKELKHQFKHLGTIRECVVFDDNPSMDVNWQCADCFLKNVDL